MPVYELVTVAPNGARGRTTRTCATDAAAIVWAQGSAKARPLGTQVSLQLNGVELWKTVVTESTATVWHTYTMRIFANGQYIEDKRTNQASAEKALAWFQTQRALYDVGVVLELYDDTGAKVTTDKGTHVLASSTGYIISLNGTTITSKTDYDNAEVEAKMVAWFDSVCHNYTTNDRLQLDKWDGKSGSPRTVITAHMGYGTPLGGTGDADDKTDPVDLGAGTYGVYVRVGAIKLQDISWKEFPDTASAMAWFVQILSETDAGTFLGLYLGDKQVSYGEGTKGGAPPPPDGGETEEQKAARLAAEQAARDAAAKNAAEGGATASSPTTDAMSVLAVVGAFGLLFITMYYMYYRRA